jgi:catechol 2,3-dioxygenase-like lactoylglutathione lyase family enzyme
MNEKADYLGSDFDNFLAEEGLLKETEATAARRIRSIASLALVVRDYDEAIAFFTQALRFTLLEDTPMGEGKRWVVVAPPGSNGASLVLAQAATPEQQAHIGNQTGGRVFLFLHTSDFWDALPSSRGTNRMGWW